jgi:hypothetical protein
MDATCSNCGDESAAVLDGFIVCYRCGQKERVEK